MAKKGKKKKMNKQAVKKAHRIGDAIKESGSDVDNPYAVGMAAEKKKLARQKRKKKAGK